MHLLLQPVPLTLKQATVDPHLHQRLLDTHGHVWVSFLWGHCSFLLGPCAYKVLFMPSKSLFPQSFVFWWFYGGVNGDHLQEGLCHTRSAIPIAPAAGTADPYLQRRHSDTVLAQCLWVGGVFCALPRSEQLRQPGAWQAHCPRWPACLNHRPSPSRSVSPSVPYVSSGELISDCDLRGGCQPSRISERHG